MLESAEAQAGEAVRELRHYASRVDLDPEALREAEARIEALHAAARKHRVRPEELPARLAELEKRLHELELAGEPGGAASAKWPRRATRYDAAAKKLSAKRAAGGAGAVARRSPRRMQQLAMAGGALRGLAAAAGRAGGAAGAEEVEFEVASHPSLPLRPLAKVASGGELSRISLAIQLVAAKASPVGDAGVRRGRLRHRRRGRRDHRPLAASALGKTAPGAVRHPPAAGRGERRRSTGR